MKTNRRDFIKTAGLAGTGMVAGSVASCSDTPSPAVYDIDKDRGSQIFNMCGYAAPKLDVIRMGFIGIGNMGTRAVQRMRLLEGVQIRALCDLHMDRVERAQEFLEEMQMPPAAAYADGSHDLWKKMVEEEDLDLVYICTPRAQHTEQCVISMENGAHVATEIPASATLDECWQLVETSERTRKYCCMIENCTYDFWEIMVLNMVHEGFFGEICHVDMAYIADQRNTNLRKDLEWRTREFINRNGNIYPTHGLGPGCQILGINRGDQLDYMTSISSNDFTMGLEIERRAKEDDYYQPFIGQWELGNMNTSILRTEKGKTMMLQYMVGNPRPGTRVHWVVGSRGISKKQPRPFRISHEDYGNRWLNDEELKALEEKYTPPIIRIAGEMARKVGGHGGMDWIKEWRLIDCLRNGLPLDMDVYDAASWSAIVPLSEWSVANYGSPVKVPDFTRGAYKTNPPVDVAMKLGGGDTRARSIPDKPIDDPYEVY